MTSKAKIPQELLDLLQSVRGKRAICQGKFDKRYLQIDHRIPYEIAGERGFPENDTSIYMLVCATCNRAKSWSCEHCPNWRTKALNSCRACYWVNPLDYTHIALREVRRVAIFWDEDEIEVYQTLQLLAGEADLAVPDYVKQIIRAYIT